MSNWVISVAAWGERCSSAFINTTLPALEIAAQRITGRKRLVIHTDCPAKIKASITGWQYTLREPPGGRTPHHQLGNANREAIELAEPGEAIGFVNADMIASREVFSVAEGQFDKGKRLIMIMGTRTFGGTPPIGADAQTLLRWSWSHKHQWTRDNIWPSLSNAPSVLYFEYDDTVIMRGFHLHPFATIKDRKIGFFGCTTDEDLGADLPHDSIHVVTSAQEAAFAEMSPREKDFGRRGDPHDVASIVQWARRRTNALHRYLITNPIVIRGELCDIGDGLVVEELLAALAVPEIVPEVVPTVDRAEAYRRARAAARAKVGLHK